MLRVNVYVDGFNLYHSAFQKRVDKQNSKSNIKKYIGFPDLRWCDLDKLSKQFVNIKKEELNEVKYFSATPLWIKNKAEKHRLYLDALRSVGVKIILGKFKEKDRKCYASCKEYFKSHEEKETDINIAINLLSDAFEDKFDIALIISGDSDLSPAIQKVKKLFPKKRIGVILPPYQFGADLKNSSDYVKKIKRLHLRRALLPEQIKFAGNLIQAPNGWLPVLDTSNT